MIREQIDGEVIRVNMRVKNQHESENRINMRVKEEEVDHKTLFEKYEREFQETCKQS